MQREELIEIVAQYAREYGVETVWLFGSCLKDPEHARDIDLAVDNVPNGKFFHFFADLMFALPKPVDLVDLSLDPPIAPLVLEEGVRIYDRGAEVHVEELQV
jgi:predicted nucleotidyltransferase